MEEQEKEQNISQEVEKKPENTKKKAKRDRKDVYKERIKKNRERIAYLENVILKSQQEIEKLNADNFMILKEIMEKSEIDDKLIEIILGSQNNDEVINKVKEMAEML